MTMPKVEFYPYAPSVGEFRAAMIAMGAEDLDEGTLENPEAAPSA
jgi:hypothetical protein